MTSRRHAVKPLMAAIFIADRDIRPDFLDIAGRLPPHCAILYRDYHAPDRGTSALRLRRIAERRGNRLIVAADAELAARIGADGLHLPRWMLERNGLLRERFPLLTAACHDRREIAAALRAGVDAILVSPLFPTASHPELPALGPRAFRALIAGCPVPVYALGGIDRSRIAQVPAGVGIAAGSAFADPLFRRHQKLKRVPR